MFDPETLKSIIGAIVDNFEDGEPPWVDLLREEIYAHAENYDDPNSREIDGFWVTAREETRMALAEAPLSTIFRLLAEAANNA